LSGRVEGKVALITGAARGLGRSHALTLAREGSDIIAVDICAPIETVTDYPMPGPEDLTETARLVKQHDRRCVARQVDVRERRDLVDAVAEAVSELGHLDIVVANAGIVVNSDGADSITFLDTITVNLSGVVNTVRAAMPHLGPGASIVAIGSFASLVNHGRAATANPNPGLLGYTHAKRAVARFVHDLAIQAGPDGIRVNAVHPGNVATDMLLNDALFKVFRPDLENPTRADAEPVMAGMHRLPVGLLEPADISNAVLYLASDESRAVTGLQLKVEAGGLLATTTSGAPG
jgi:SDR family mycofactocin-dependent oxidoreductase